MSDHPLLGIEVVMRRLTIVTVLMLVSALVAIGSSQSAGAALGPNLIRNGSFEYPNVALGEVLNSGDTMGRWRVTDGDIDLLDVDYIWPAGTGEQSIDLSGFGDGTIEQRVATVPGRSYLLRFQAAVNVDSINCPDPDKTLIVRFGGRHVASMTISNIDRNYSNIGWTWSQFRVVATSSGSTVSFRSSTTNSPCGPTLDSVSLRVIK